MVDTLVIGIGVHPGKTPLFSPQEKIEMLKAETAAIAKTTGAKIEIITFDNLTVDAAKAAGATSSSAACATAPISTTRCRWRA